MFTKKRLYMDYASSTPIAKEVQSEMFHTMSAYGNPSAPHKEGRDAKQVLENARARIARVLSVRPETLYFTGSGTESNNMAIVGFIEGLIAQGATYKNLHIIVSDIEHPSINAPLAYLVKKGVQVSYVSPNEEGVVTVEAVLKHLKKDTILVSLVLVQSEIGQIQPVRDIAYALHEVRNGREQTHQHLTPACALPILHTDASQGAMYLNVSPETLGAQLVTYDAQKIHGPKGVGLLYKHSSVPLSPVVRGGSQERTLRAGTENVVGVVGMARAFELTLHRKKERIARVTAVRDYFISLLKKHMPDIEINGGMKHRIANNIHISIPRADGDYMAVLMDKEGVAVSPRSACIASGTTSHTVEALGKSKSQALGTLRFSFSPHITKRDAQQAFQALKRARAIVEKI